MRDLHQYWTDRSTLNCSTILMLCMAVLLGACGPDEPFAPSESAPPDMQLGAAPLGPEVAPQGPAIQPIRFGNPSPAPISLGIDVAQLVPATVELSVPTLCGALTVFDEEDLAVLCSPTTLAATRITEPTCPQPVSGSVRLEVDLVCTDESGLIVDGDNTVIDLNGHTISCTGAGYESSCQGGGDDFGILVEGRRNVHIFSHREDGTITGFDAAINIQNSDNVKVKQVIATGPVGIPGVQRPRTVGIMIQGVDCGGGNVRIGGGTKTGNDVSNHTRGIQLDNSSCVYIGYNEVHDNRAEFAPLHIPEDLGGGIGVFNSPDNHIRSNVVFDNGDNNPFEGGIGLIFEATTGNLVVENQANENRGNGIETIGGASNNYIVNNEMLRNDHFDAFSDAGSMNRWNENNRCVTQTEPPPPGVCGPDEA